MPPDACPAPPAARCRRCPEPPAAGRVLCPRHLEQNREYHERRRRRLGARPAPPLLPCGLTGRQREIVRLLYHHQAAGRMPTFRGLMGPLGIGSTNGLAAHLEALARKGWLRRAPATRGRFPYELAGLRLAPAFVGADGERLKRAVEGP